jgi:Flp pilus assembly protein TadD
MSLLMKALEKAAKDRGETRAEPPVATTPVPAKSELSLEPMSAEAPAAPRADTTPRMAPTPRTAAVAIPAPAARESAPAREQVQAQAQAAAVMQAAAGGASADSSGVVAYLRAHPVIVLGILAALFAAAFGVYVYIQIFNPGLLTGRPLIAPKAPLPPLTQAPVAPPPAEPLPTAPLLKDAADEAAAAAARAKPLPTPPAAPPEEAARGNTIVVSPGSPEPVLNPLLAQAYAALQSNQIESARDLYQKMRVAEPKNADALLGLAAIAVRQGNPTEATRLYLQILELDPRHALAQSGLIALLGRADPLAAETRLKQLIAREPSGYLYFTLGNLYADQAQWAAAQQAYFQAHHLEAANPDYAYNLAVALEHVSQPKLALGFYRRAVQLAAAKGRANFDSAQAQGRIGKLAQQVE